MYIYEEISRESPNKGTTSPNNQQEGWHRC
jgi:hypothetical protein